MDHFKILKRALELTWRYRALWVFGILIALTTGGGGGGGGGSPGGGSGGVSSQLGDFTVPDISPEVVSALIAMGIGLLCLIALMSIAGLAVRYASETALIRMVNAREETGEEKSVRWGLRQGWSRAAWYLFLIDLLIGLPVFLVFVLLFLLAFAPLLLWFTGSQTAGFVGTMATVGLIIPLVFLVVLVSVVLSLLTHFFRRTCVLESLGVVESIRHGFGIVRRHLKDVGVMWLMMVGLGLAWGFVMLPLGILLALVALTLSGVPALLVGGLTSLVFEGALPWILAAAVGFPIFILVIAVPALFLGGLVEVFKSSVWTLAYGELRALEKTTPDAGRLPEPDTTPVN